MTYLSYSKFLTPVRNDVENAVQLKGVKNFTSLRKKEFLCETQWNLGYIAPVLGLFVHHHFHFYMRSTPRYMKSKIP